MTTRVLVAHDAGARIFEHRGRGKGLVQLSDVPFEDGRRHVGELDSDRQGRAFDRSGQGRHAFEPQQDAKEHAVQRFAKQLVQDLSRQCHNGEFRQLFIVAPPRFLGVLRDSLDGKLEKALIGTLAKDLPRATAEELEAQLSETLVL